MRVETSMVASLGVDTVMRLDGHHCESLFRDGISFVIRYLGMVTKEELYTILGHGLGFMPVTLSRKTGWVPSLSLGVSDGEKAVSRLEDLGIPEGCTVWLDLEGCAGPVEDTIGWVEGWSNVVVEAGYEAGLYVGANPGGMDSVSLWKLKNVTRYWRSCSRVPEPAVRGWCMMQLKPWNQRLGDLMVDYNIIENDYKGCRPKWVIQ